MTWFGWIIVALCSLTLANPKTDNNARYFLVAIILGALIVGTGNGL